MSQGILSKINNEAFEKYRSYYSQETAVVCGTGSTLNDYKKVDGAIHIGCNRCVFFDKFIFDFYFVNDWSRIKTQFRSKILEYEPNIDKFFGTFIHDRKFGCSPQNAIDGNGKLYDMECSFSPNGAGYQKDISKYCVGNKGQSTIFSCMQFALFAGFKEIFIVGCDLNNTQFVKIPNWDNGYHSFKNKWLGFKEFVIKEFSNTNIYVINPRGLKGIFPTISN